MDGTDGWTRRYSELTAFPKAVTKAAVFRCSLPFIH